MNTQRFGIALLIIVGFFAVLAYMIWSSHVGTDLMVGALISAFALATKYFLDSSPGSDKKTDLLARAQPVPSEFSIKDTLERNKP